MIKSVTDLPFYKDEGSETLAKILALRGQYRTDSLVMAVDDRLQQRPGDLYNQIEYTIMATEELERQVNNGGFCAFFENYPELVSDIVVRLNEIGCDQTSEIVAKAIAALGPVDLQDAAAISAAAGNVDFEEIDQEFYSYPVLIDEMLFLYIERNQTFIRVDPPKKTWFQRLTGK